MKKTDLIPEYDDSIMTLPYNTGDTVYVFDVSEERAYRARVRLLGLPKKAEHRAIVITLLEDGNTEPVRKSVGKTAFVTTTQAELRELMTEYYMTKIERVKNLNLDLGSAELW